MNASHAQAYNPRPGNALAAGRDITIAAQETSSASSHFNETKKSGLFSSGGLSVTLGKQQHSTDQQNTATGAAASTIGAVAGDVNIVAGQNYRQTGSDLLAPQGDINVLAQKIAIVEARETRQTVIEQKSRQSGLTLALTSPVISAVQTMQGMAQAAGNTGDTRMKALAAGSAALAAKSGYDAIKAGQGSVIDGQAGRIATKVDGKGKVLESRDANLADQAGGINLSISIGGSQSQSKTVQSSSTAQGSTLAAGRDIKLTATGAGQESDLTIQGSSLSAARDIKLQADNDLKLLAAQNSADQKSSNKSSSASVGISIGSSGFGVTVAASGARGRADGNDVTQTNTQIVAGKRIDLESGNDTTLKGAVASAEQVTARVGRDLNIESLQDTSIFKSRQQSLGGSVTVGAGVSGSISASRSNTNSNYASVTEQSGIKAGDGGFQVNVQGNTDLKGAVITSTQAAVDQNLNRFQTGGQLTTSDIQNTASYSGQAVGLSVGTSVSLDGKLAPSGTGIGFGKDSGNAQSTTQAAISGIAGNTAARTGDAETGIAKIFDADKVQKEINAQVIITQAFGREAPRAAADFAGQQGKVLIEQARQESDPDKRAALLAEANKWEEGGAYRIALQTVVGGLAGGVSGALGAGATAAAAPLLNELQYSIVQTLKDAGASDTLANLAGQTVSLTTAAGIGAIAGGGNVAGVAAGFNVDANNRQLHPDEEKWLRDKAKDFAKKENITEKEALARLTQQSLKEVDFLWRAQLADGDDASAKAFLATNQQTFTNDLGVQQKLFTAQGQQLFRPEMFADSADPAFYKQFAQSGINRSLSAGLTKELKDSGIALKDGAIDLARAARDNPGAVLNGLWNAIQSLPGAVVDGFRETGAAIGEGSAVALNADINAKLNAIYGNDVSGYRQALLAIRTLSAISGAAGVAKVGVGLSEGAAKAVGKKLDEVLDQKASEALLKSGGVIDKSGQPLLDLKQLTTEQKGVMGELFGANTVKQIVPDGQKLARIPGVGETGLDDLYKVNRKDVDYVVIEYKFVGDNATKGSARLKNTDDGKQGSEGWTRGGDRLPKAVGEENAILVDRAIKAGRIETYVVTTRANGSTEIEVLDSFGKPKPIDTSRILIPGTNLSGAKP